MNYNPNGGPYGLHRPNFYLPLSNHNSLPSQKNACYLKLLENYRNCKYTYCEAKQCIDSLNDSSYDIGYFSTNPNCKNKDWKTSC